MTKAKSGAPTTAAKRKPTKAVAKVERVPGRLLQKVEIEDGTLTITADQAAVDALRKALATTSPDFESYVLTHLFNVVKPKNATDATVQVNAAVIMLEGIGPTNELEAMLAAQMIVTHHLSMEMARRTMTADQIPQFDANGKMMTKFSRTFVAQMEALSKLRRGGEQVVRHVHVNEGGQALIAGTVHTGGSANG